MRQLVSLALGSGGARGYAHIGAIEALEKRGYTIQSISGSSMGALVGGFYAAGSMEEFKHWALKIDWLSALKLVDLSLLSSGGAIKGERVFERLEPFFGSSAIEKLPIRYTAVATDLDAQKEIWFQEGDLRTAVRASIAIPTVFTPVHHNGRVLVDGGMLNPLPIAPLMSDHTDLIVAVSVSASQSSPREPFEAEAAKPAASVKERAKMWLNNLGIWDAKAEASVTQLDIFQRVIEVMQNVMMLYKIAGYLPDILVEIPIDSCRVYDFHKAKEMIALGYELTMKAIDKHEARASR
ncbi:MAG: patatin-like phospholipase family protein [Helicobacteraceae bacterium]|jgi:NTE family protein|nr:patatin-like phospholipase family protein [Helicobacteraceae bacterium]